MRNLKLWLVRQLLNEDVFFEVLLLLLNSPFIKEMVDKTQTPIDNTIVEALKAWAEAYVNRTRPTNK